MEKPAPKRTYLSKFPLTYLWLRVLDEKDSIKATDKLNPVVKLVVSRQRLGIPSMYD